MKWKCAFVKAALCNILVKIKQLFQSIVNFIMSCPVRLNLIILSVVACRGTNSIEFEIVLDRYLLVRARAIA